MPPGLAILKCTQKYRRRHAEIWPTLSMAPQLPTKNYHQKKSGETTHMGRLRWPSAMQHVKIDTYMILGPHNKLHGGGRSRNGSELQARRIPLLLLSRRLSPAGSVWQALDEQT